MHEHITHQHLVIYTSKQRSRQ